MPLDARNRGLMLAGGVVGLAPIIVAIVVKVVSPSTVLPLSEYYFLTLGLIPITFALAAVRSARAAT